MITKIKTNLKEFSEKHPEVYYTLTGAGAVLVGYLVTSAYQEHKNKDNPTIVAAGAFRGETAEEDYLSLFLSDGTVTKDYIPLNEK